MTPLPSPPRLAARLLRWSLSPEDRQPQLGDLQEEFATLAERRPAAARRWYWRQALTSVVPNVVRRVRHGWHLISRVADDKDRKSRRWRRWGGTALAISGVAFAAGVARPHHDDDWLSECVLFAVAGGLVALTGSYRAMQFRARSRRGRLLMASIWFTVPFPFLEIGSHHDLSVTLRTLQFSIYGVQTLLWFWPNATWPFHRPRTDEISLRAPVLQPWTNDKFETLTVPAVPFEMSAPIVGFPASDEVMTKAGSVRPMRQTMDRVFSAAETIRLFAIVNAPPDAFSSSLEIRRGSTGRLIASLPVAVRPGVPLLTAKQQYQRDPDDDPLKPIPIRASELDVVVSLAGLAPGDYTLRIVAHHLAASSFEHVDITVRPEISYR